MNPIFDNIILNTDSYKSSHFLQYPPGAQTISSYVESRGGDYPEIIFFGLQMFLKEYLCAPINQAMIDEAEMILSAHGVPFNKAGWRYILDKHGGYLPVAIEAVPEGQLMGPGQVMLQMVNTDENCFWLTNYLETMVLRACWYPTTVATRSYQCKKLIHRFLTETADDTDGLTFKLHDFGARGVSSQESAAISGLAHLVNFQGTDTLAAVLAAKRYYNESAMPAFSIPAAEHSTITAWGQAHEKDAYGNMLKQFLGPDKAVAVVSDSYDLWKALAMWGDDFKTTIKQSGGALIVRPDSGDPVEIVLKTVQTLAGYFGVTENAKGYQVLPSYVRVIQGDGVNINSIEQILQALKNAGFSAENIAFGMGAGLLQKLNRDILKFAMKASAIKVNGEWRDVFKDPVTDPGKQSKKGRLALVQNDQGGLETVRLEQLNNRRNWLKPVFRNGELLQEYSLAEIRERAGLSFS